MHPYLEERTIAGLHASLEYEIAGLSRTTSVLDLGCGSGAWLERLIRLGFQNCWGVDAGPVPAVERLNFIRANLDREQPQIAHGKFGLITSIEVIEHLENPGAVLSLISNHLADDGLALITSPNMHSLRCRLKFLLTGLLASFDEKGDPTHITPLFLPGFRKISARYGLAIERCWTYPPSRSLIFGAPIRGLASLLRPFLEDPLPGDTLCLILRRSSTNLRSPE